MFQIQDPELHWLTVTNIALGAVALLCVGAISAAVVHELLARARQRVTSALPAIDDHTFFVPELGVTMADGGEVIDAQAGDAPAGEPKPSPGA